MKQDIYQADLTVLTGKETLKIQGRFGEEMSEKLKREINTVLYGRDNYYQGFDTEFPGFVLKKLARTAKGVLP